MMLSSAWHTFCKSQQLLALSILQPVYFILHSSDPINTSNGRTGFPYFHEGKQASKDEVTAVVSETADPTEGMTLRKIEHQKTCFFRTRKP